MNHYLSELRHTMVEPDVLEENFSSIYLLRRDLKQRCHDTNKNTYALIFSLIVLNISYVNKFICCMIPLHKFGFSLYITFFDRLYSSTYFQRSSLNSQNIHPLILGFLSSHSFFLKYLLIMWSLLFPYWFYS